MRTFLLLLIGLSPLMALDELEKEVARYNVEVTKLNTDHDAAVGKAKQKSLTTLERLATKQTRAGDLPGATLAWKEVLRLDQDHAEARRFFTAQGTLDAVLVEVNTVTDALGNPISKAADRHLLLLVDDATLTARGPALGVEFAAGTVELLIGTLQGDGSLYREGGTSNGQSLSVSGNQLTFLARTGGVPFTINAPIDRTQPLTHIAGVFNDGQLSLWVNGRLAANGKAPFAAVPSHADQCTIGGLATGGVAIAGFRLTRAVRYQAAFTAPTDLATDANTVLAINAATLTPLMSQATSGGAKSQPIILTTVPGVPDATLAWSANGSVGLK